MNQNRLIMLVAILMLSPLSSCSSEPKCPNWKSVDFDIQYYCHLEKVRGVSSDDFWIVGEETLLRCDGSSCTPANLTHTENYYGAWVSSSSDAWFSGFGAKLIHFNGNIYQTVPLDIQATGIVFLSEIWSDGGDNLWVIGWEWVENSSELISSIVMHRSGQEWTRFENTPVDYLDDIWGLSSEDIWIVGSETILHWDGTDLVQYENSPAINLEEVWGSSSEDVWIVTHDGKILHWDGIVWSEKYDLGTSDEVELRGVWGFGQDDIWAVGSHIVRFNDDEYTIEGEGCGGILESVWGTDSENLWVVGEEATVLKRK